MAHHRPNGVTPSGAMLRFPTPTLSFETSHFTYVAAQRSLASFGEASPNASGTTWYTHLGNGQRSFVWPGCGEDIQSAIEKRTFEIFQRRPGFLPYYRITIYS